MKLSKKAIIYGALTDVVGSILIGIILIIGFVTAGSDINTLLDNSYFISISMFLGLTMSVLGGFIAAKLGKNLPIAHAVRAGMVVMTYSIIVELISFVHIYFTQAPFDITELIRKILLIPLALPAAYLGGYIFKTLVHSVGAD